MPSHPRSRARDLPIVRIRTAFRSVTFPQASAPPPPTPRPLAHGVRVTAGSLAVVLAAGTTGLALPAAGAAEAVGVQSFTGTLGSATGEAVSPQSCDFTGDGRPDAVVSAWMWDRTPYGSIGATYVLPGGSSTPGMLDDPASGAIRIEGPQTEDPLTGFSVSCLGDVDGDGIDDIAISDYVDSRAYVVFGSREKENLSLEYLGDRGFIIQSPEDDRTGYQVSGVGDLDGDGLSDIAVVSLTGGDRGGRISIVRGQEDISTVSLDDPEKVLARINGSRNRAVSSVAPAGDVNGDGTPDLVLGGYVARTGVGESTANGMAWVVFGPTSGDVDLSGPFPGFTVTGPDRGRDRLGIAVSALGDIDHDGFDDVALGADGVSARVDGALQTRPGAVAMVRGSSSTATVRTDPDAANGHAVFTDAASDEGQGHASASGAAAADGGPSPSVQDRGWWLTPGTDHSTNFGYALSARKPAGPESSGTLIVGAWQASAAYAIDTRALTSPVVRLNQVPDDQIVELVGEDGARMGRAVGYIEDFNGSGPAMIAGGAVPAGAGHVSVTALPAQGRVAADPAPSEQPTAEPSASPSMPPTSEPSTTPEPGSTPEPSTTPEPNTTPEPSATIPVPEAITTGSPSGGTSEVGPDGPGDDLRGTPPGDPARTDPQQIGEASPAQGTAASGQGLATTGARSTLLVLSAVVALSAGAGAILISRRRRNS